MSALFLSVLKESLGPDPEWDAIHWSDEDWDEDWDDEDYEDWDEDERWDDFWESFWDEAERESAKARIHLCIQR